MYKDRKNRSFGADFPGAWQEISRAESGQFVNAAGLFTFATVYPFPEALKSSTGSGEAFEPSAGYISGKNYHWKIISRVPPGHLNQESRKSLRGLQLLDSFFIVLVGVGSWLLSGAYFRRRQAELAVFRAKEKLELRVKERTAELVKTNEKMKQEIRERKHAKEALRESEERYRTLISEMLNGFALHEIMVDSNGKPYDYRFLEVNFAFEEMTELKGVNIVGKTVLEVLPKTEPYWIETYGEVALTGKSIRFENYSQELDKYFEVLAYSPQKGQCATVFTDITDRRQSEELLRESEEKYRTVVDNISDGVYSVDDRGYFTFLNKVAEERSGITADKLSQVHYLDIVAQDYQDSVRENFERTMKGEDLPPYEIEYASLEEKTLSVEVNTKPILKENKIVGIMGVALPMILTTFYP
jgi:PAS domain S-box-containing protein